ncbi:MAG: FkbM family methyltransferase [Methylocella sp.]
MSKIISYIRRNGLPITVQRVSNELRNIVYNNYYKINAHKYVRSFYGVLMRANWEDTTFTFCINASYGYYYSNYLRKIDFPFILFDIGANQGLYSLLAARNRKCIAVFAFEPVEKTYSILLDNIKKNGFSKIINPVEAAVSSESGFATINVKQGHSGVSSLTVVVDVNNQNTEVIKLMDRRDMERLVDQDARIVVKIDVEGHEEVVIKEISECSFFDRVESIFYEIDESWSESSVIEFQLRQKGITKFEKIGNGKHYDVFASRVP